MFPYPSSNGCYVNPKEAVKRIMEGEFPYPSSNGCYVNTGTDFDEPTTVYGFHTLLLTGAM